MPKPSFFQRCLPVLLGLAASTFADTVVLKSGEKMEGRILSETPTQVTLEVKVTATIKDERVIKRTDIEKIDKVQADEEAWAAIKGIALASESFEVLDYQRLASVLENFASQFPQSAHAAEAKAKAAAFDAEKKRVEGGEMKLDGKWLTKDQVEEERLQVGGHVLLSRMKRLAAAGQLIEAMNVFDSIEKNYPGSAALPDAIELARRLLPGIQATALQQKERLKTQAEQNKRRLDTAQGQEKEQLANVIRTEAATAAAAAAAAEKSGAKWLPFIASDTTLTAIGSRASSELTTLSNKPVDKMREAIACGEEIRKDLEAKDVTAAEKALTKAQSAWSTYELLKRLSPKVAEARKEATTEKAAAQAAAQAEAAAKVAAAAAQVKAEKEAKAKKDAEAAAVVQPKPVEEEPPFYTKPILWVVLVLAALFGTLGFKAYQKFRDPNRNILDQ